jgi:hypothetical protein
MDLHRAMGRVPREARVLLALRYVDGLSYGELARIRGVSVNTVKSQLARGKALLRAHLGPSKRVSTAPFEHPPETDGPAEPVLETRPPVRRDVHSDTLRGGREETGDDRRARA